MDSRNGAGSSDVTSLYIGLGPAAHTISEGRLRSTLEEFAKVLAVRIRGRCAFVDVGGMDDAKRLIEELDGKFIGEARMVVQLSRGKERDRDRDWDRERDRRRINDRDRVRDRERPGDRDYDYNRERVSYNHSESRRGGDNGRTALFVGLGPAGRSITDRELRNKLEEAAPIIGFRRRGECAFVDVPSMADARRTIEMMNNQYMGDCRLSVQHSRGLKRSRSEERDDRQRHRQRSSSRDRRRRRPRSRSRSRSRRSESRTARRNRRSHSRSRSRSPPSSRSSYSRQSSVASVGSRGRDRRRRGRSRSRSRSGSGSSASRSSTGSYRKRRD